MNEKPVTPRRITRLFPLLGVVSACLAPFQGEAQIFSQNPPDETGLQVRLYCGLSEGSGLYRKNVWIPFQLEVDNPTEKAIEGSLVVTPFSETFTGKEEYRFRVPFQFAPRQRKLLRLLGRLPEWTEDATVHLEPGSGRTPLASVGVREMDPTERLVVVLSENPAAYRPFEKETVSAESIQGQPRFEISVQTLSRTDFLPDAVEGYDTISLIVWDGLRPGELSPDQITALQRYVELGGVLILALGDRGERLNLPGWRELLNAELAGSTPLRVGGAVDPQIEFDPNDLLVSAIQWSAAPSAGSDATQTALLAAIGNFSGEPCLTLEGEPVLFRRSHGAGYILASRIKWADWLRLGEVSREFWRDFIQSRPILPPTCSLGWETVTTFKDYLKTSLLGELPGPWFIGGFLGLYTVLAIPVNYFLFRKRKRLELAWLALPPLAILFSFLAYHIGALQQQRGVVQREIVLGFQPYGSTIARTQILSGVYSPRRRFFDLSVGEEPAFLLPTVANPNDPNEVEIDLTYLPVGTGGSYRVLTPDLLVHHWAAEHVGLDTVTDLGGAILVEAVELPAANDDYRFRVKVENKSHYDLKKAYFLRVPLHAELGPVAKEASIEKVVAKADMARWDAPSHREWGGRNYYNLSRFHKKPINDFLNQHGYSLMANLPLGIPGGEKRAFDYFAPPGTTRDNLYAMVEIEESIHPIELDADLFGHEAVSLVLTPVMAKREGEEFVTGPLDWTYRIEDMHAGLTLGLGKDAYAWGYWPNPQILEKDSFLTVDSELGFKGVLPATFTLVARPNLSESSTKPLQISVECISGASPQGVFHHSELRGKDYIIFFEWSLFDYLNDRWMIISLDEKAVFESNDFTFTSHLDPETYLSPDGVLKIRVGIRLLKKSGDPIDLRGGEFWGSGLKLPQLTMIAEKR